MITAQANPPLAYIQLPSRFPEFPASAEVDVWASINAVPSRPLGHERMMRSIYAAVAKPPNNP